MDHDAKLKFIHNMTKLGLEHTKQPESVQNFDSGGMVKTQGLKPANNNNLDTSYMDPTKSWGGGIATSLGLQSTYHAGGADLQQGTNTDQLGKSYSANQEALSNTNKLANTLAPQSTGAVGQQQDLANQYQRMINGEGPNVAQNQLNQATGQNIANQAALMAGQRGAATNPGLIARQAAMQGAATQQDAVGQAATLQAQQQVAAQQNLAALSANQINQAGQAVTNQNLAQQGEQNILQNANTALNNNAVGMQSNINSTNAQIASANANGIGGLIGGGISAIGALFMADGGEVKDPSDMPIQEFAAGGRANPLVGNPLVQGGGMAPSAASSSFVGNYLNTPISVSGSGGGGEALHFSDSGAKAMQQGGADLGAGIKKRRDKNNAKISGSSGEMPDGSYNSEDALPDESYSADSAGGGLGSLLDSNQRFGAEGGEIGDMPKTGDLAKLAMKLAPFLAAMGGKVPALVSPGEVFLDPKKAKKVANGDAHPIKEGKKIPGKPKYPGNDYRNDVVPAKLQEGGIVIPNEITEIENTKLRDKKAVEFVRAALAKNKHGLRKKKRNETA